MVDLVDESKDGGLQFGDGAKHAAFEAVHIVLSDVEMPGARDGFALARWVREHRPTLQVILAGSAARATKAAGELCNSGPMLAKPYDPQIVLDQIKRLLATKPTK